MLLSSHMPGLLAARPRVQGTIGRPSSRRTVSVRAVADVKKATLQNGAATGADAIKEDVKHELHYRLAAGKVDDQSVYDAVAWSVHNRLLDAWEETHAHWKCVAVARCPRRLGAHVSLRLPGGARLGHCQGAWAGDRAAAGRGGGPRMMPRPGHPDPSHRRFGFFAGRRTPSSSTTSAPSS